MFEAIEIKDVVGNQVMVTRHSPDSQVQLGVEMVGPQMRLGSDADGWDDYGVAALYVHLDTDGVASLVDALGGSAHSTLDVEAQQEARRNAYRNGWNAAVAEGRPREYVGTTPETFKENTAVMPTERREPTLGELGLCGQTPCGQTEADQCTPGCCATETILQEAERIIDGPRAAYYGEATQNHKRIANLWNAYLTSRPAPLDPLEPHEVALLMILMKMARLIETPVHRDSHVDMCGYAALAYKMAEAL